MATKVIHMSPQIILCPFLNFSNFLKSCQSYLTQELVNKQTNKVLQSVFISVLSQMVSCKGLFIYYLSKVGGEGVSQMLTFTDMGGRGCQGKSDMLT